MKKMISFEDAIIHDGKVYFASDNSNELFCMDIVSGKIQKLVNIHGEDECGYRLYGSIQCDGDNIFLIPLTAKKMAVFNIEKGILRQVDLTVDSKANDECFMASELIGSKLFLFSIRLPYIYMLDTKTLNIELVCDWGKIVKKDFIFDEDDIFFRRQVAVIGDFIYIPFCNANGIMIFNARSYECEIRDFKLANNGYSGVINVGEWLYCSPRKVGMRGIKWNIVSNEYSYLDVENELTVGMCIINNEPIYASSNRYIFYRKEDDSCIYYGLCDSMLHIYDGKDSFEYVPKVILSPKEKRRLVKGRILEENRLINLNEFLLGITE